MVNYLIKYFKKLNANPKLDLTCSYTVSKSIYEILDHEKFVNKFKIYVSLFGLFLTLFSSVIAVFCFNYKVEISVIGTTLSLLITALAVDEATDNKKDLVEALQSKINDLNEGELRQKYLDLLFRIVEAQSFSK